MEYSLMIQPEGILTDSAHCLPDCIWHGNGLLLI